MHSFTPSTSQNRPRPGTTFVLVHGGWHGGWCWSKVSPQLRAAGHTVYTPTLTGLGERAHLLAPMIDLEWHIRDILNVLDYEDLESVVLVGHSYGGMVIRGVADRAPQRVQRVVFLDAFVPEDGQSALDLLAPERSAQLRDQAQTEGDGWRIPTQAPERYGVVDPADLEWARPRLGAQPLATLEQQLRITNPATMHQVRRSYIACTEFEAFRPFARRAQTEPDWDYREVASGHDAMIIRPKELTDHLLAIAALGTGASTSVASGA
jgi:pimeloyl-ACP methyl ester carboxylesterase